ncbi:hypothetical protein [Mucilaginibacter sp. MD40]|uniref:hypothetical protein n=1 Tax=Mucilaginibacter sp. MD40 TaxID=2029590 RepID=UPI001E4BE8EE|nr:hypothetical protein [Mucilaginibacter sp. MD40]
MKKIFQTAVAILAVSFIFSACSSTQNTQTGGTSAMNVSRGKFVGTWVCNSVSYNGLLPGAVQNVFDQAPPAAFEGSTWKLTNSGNGMYSLTNGQSQTIFWSVYNGNGATQFQFKKIYQGDKAKNVQEGYRLNVGAMTGTNMTLLSPVPVGNGIGYIVYTFTKQ